MSQTLFKDHPATSFVAPKSLTVFMNGQAVRVITAIPGTDLTRVHRGVIAFVGHIQMGYNTGMTGCSHIAYLQLRRPKFVGETAPREIIIESIPLCNVVQVTQNGREFKPESL